VLRVEPRLHAARHRGAGRHRAYMGRRDMAGGGTSGTVQGRGLHSLTSELNLRTFGNVSLTLELDLSTFISSARVNLSYMGDT
jgi:hypothetical protein